MRSNSRLTLPAWDALTCAEREAAARRIAEHLPEPFQFKGLKTHSLGAQTHETALFGWKRSTFALILGGAANLGYDESASPFPDEAQRENWEATEADFNVSLGELLQESMTPPRTIVFEPFLMEVRPTRLPEYADWHRVTERVAKQGFRPPTPDEWEYACGAGSRTLFRWGDTCPLDTLPIDRADWDGHQQPNAFGLRMPSDPYRWELTSEPGVMRGGDGGGTICGGMGELAGWLPLATPFTVTWENEYEVIGAFLRRVYPLG